MGTKFILVIDDEKDIDEVIHTHLKTAGYADRYFDAPADAIFFFEHYPKNIDLVITDLTMPGMRGIEVAERMLSLKPKLPIMLITGYPETEVPPEKNSLFAKILLKPFTRNELWEAVEKVLGNPIV